MRIIDQFPHTIRELENCWIPLSDGCRLAARVWLPVEADRRPVPAIVEYIPYRKRDGTRLRDEPMHRYFAGHGYAALRVDLRGSGDSDGLLLDEYLEQEQRDGVELIAWIASQPWCNGSVGLMGKSWGGFNALQIAAHDPPQLKAIITVCSTDDRYADDAHYMGGCLLNENLSWGTLFLTMSALAPDPALVGERWQEMWLARLKALPLYPAIWLRHQRRDDYWKHGSVCEDFSRIKCAVYAVGGWADGYTNAVPRLLASVSAPRKGLVGPWAHVYPHEGIPGPAIGFLQEALRWWDHWLKGVPNGVMDEPMCRLWMQESVRPKASYDERPGRWVVEPTWPPKQQEKLLYQITPQGLQAPSDSAAQNCAELEWRSPLTAGLAAGAWCSFGADGEMPTDQREDDGKSLSLDSPPLEERLEILGAPLIQLQIAVNRPQAFIAVRLNDVFPDGASTRITYGLLNLTHRQSHEELQPIEPGVRYLVTVQLNDVAYALPAGHRLRLAISTSYWPLAWPSPEPVTLSLSTEGSYLSVPRRPPRPADAQVRPFPEPEAGPPPPLFDTHPGGVERTIQRDITTGETTYTTRIDFNDSGEPALTRWEAIDLEVGHAIQERFSIRDGDPLSARAVLEHHALARRQQWETRIQTRVEFSATGQLFLLRGQLIASDGQRTIFEKQWDEQIPRNMV